MQPTRFLSRTGWLCALLVLSLLPACSGESEKSLIASAKSYLEKSDSKAAIVQLKAALQKNPNEPEARYLLGKALLDTGDATAAVVELNKALDLKHDENDVLPPLARAMQKVGQHKQLVALFGRTTLQDPAAIADLNTSLATAQLVLGSRERATIALENALRASPEFPAALLLQARLKAGERDVDGAIGIVDRVLALQPGNLDAWFLKGQLLQFGKSDEAAAMIAFRKALEIDPKSVPTHSAIVGLLLLKRDAAGFKSQLDNMRKVLPGHPQTRFFEAQVAFAERDFKKSREMTQGLLRFAPDNIRVLQLAAAIELQDANLLQAENYLAKALLLAPDLVLARQLLAQIFLKTGQANKALGVLQPVLNSSGASAEALTLAAEAHLLNGDAAKAEQYVKGAAKLSPNDPRIRTALALTTMSKGQVDAAFAELESVAQTDTGTVAEMTMISARLRRNEPDAALRAIAQLELKQPGKPFAAYLRGRVESSRKNSVAARAAFENSLSIDPSYFPAVSSLVAMDLANNKPDQARKRFDDLLKANPRNVQALLGLADLRSQTGGTADEITKLLTSAVQLNPSDAYARVTLINHYLIHKNSKAALAAAQDAVATVPNSTSVLAALGEAQFQAGEQQQAISTFNKLAAIEKSSPVPHFKLAGIHLAAGNNFAALQSLDRALAVAPKYLQAQRALVALHVSQKQIGDALKVARQVQQQRPNEDSGYLLEGDVHSADRAFSDAIKSYTNALQREQRVESAIKLHTSLIRAGNQTEAQRLLQKWLTDHPKDIQFLTALGDSALARNEFGLAESRFRAVLSRDPKNVPAMNNVAFAVLKQGKPGALPLAEQANQLMPNRSALLDTLAMALAAEKQFPRAIEMQRQAIQRARDPDPLRVNLAKIYLQAGEKELARKELESLALLGDKFGAQAEVARMLASI